MKKEMMKTIAKRHILEGIRQAINFAHSDTLEFKRDVVWNYCNEVCGAIYAYSRVQLLSDSEVDLYHTIISNISIYYDIFGRR